MLTKLFTSEAVSAGHPDKVADQVSDLVLDLALKQNPFARVACETLITGRKIVIAGELDQTLPDHVNLDREIRKLLKLIGYGEPGSCLDTGNLLFENLMVTQSPLLKEAVSQGGAGDQGLMFGFACRETPELMPLPISLCQRMMRRHAEVRATGKYPDLQPDAKCQVTVRYNGDKPASLNEIIISSQHTKGFGLEELRKLIIETIVIPSVPESYFPGEEAIKVNPSGAFDHGGPAADAGLTGRKIIADTYGGSAPHGGGAFSGKDPSKVDRSGAYMARYIAKNLVASGMAERCLVQLAYVIGQSKPASFMLDFQGTGNVREELARNTISEILDLSPSGIRHHLDLGNPIYLDTASKGHFGRTDITLPWERIDLVSELLKIKSL